MKKLRLFPLWIAAALLASVSLRGWADQAAPATADPKIKFEKYTLANGMEVILAPDKTVPLVAVSVWYHVGSGDETPGKSGFAHLFEHMMFQGAKHIGEDVHFKTLREIGASGINGTTNSDRTNYFEVVPSHQLEVALWLESDRMGYLLPTMTRKSLDNQIEVVKNERRQNYDNRPYGRELFATAAALYPEGHPYRYLTIGLHEDIASASEEDVKGFFKKWYVPSNATLTLAGDFEVDEAKKLVEKWFGSFPKTTRPARRTVAAPMLKENKRVKVDDPLAKLRHLGYAWHSPAQFADGDAEMDIVASALGNPGTGRLYKILVLEKQWARSVSVYQWGKQMSGSFHVIVELKDEAKLEDVEKIVNDELARIAKEPISQKEFDRAVIAVEAGFIWGLESLLSRAETLQMYNHYLGDPDWITRDLDRYRKSSPAKVQAVAKQVLGARRAEIITMPAEAKGGK